MQVALITEQYYVELTCSEVQVGRHTAIMGVLHRGRVTLAPSQEFSSLAPILATVLFHSASGHSFLYFFSLELMSLTV